MKRRYGIAVSAMILAIQLAGPAHSDAPSIEELERISVLLDANDVRGLRAFLNLHPDFLEGESDLSRLLRQYMEESDDPIAFIGVPPGFADDNDDGDGTARLWAALPGIGDSLEGPSDDRPPARATDEIDVSVPLY